MKLEGLNFNADLRRGPLSSLLAEVNLQNLTEMINAILLKHFNAQHISYSDPWHETVLTHPRVRGVSVETRGSQQCQGSFPYRSAEQFAMKRCVDVSSLMRSYKCFFKLTTKSAKCTQCDQHCLPTALCHRVHKGITKCGRKRCYKTHASLMEVAEMQAHETGSALEYPARPKVLLCAILAGRSLCKRASAMSTTPVRPFPLGGRSPIHLIPPVHSTI